MRGSLGRVINALQLIQRTHMRLRQFSALLVGLCAPLATSAQERHPTQPLEAVWRFAAVTFPPNADTFTVMSARRWPDVPAFGMSLTYIIPGDDITELTIYLYPLGEGGRASAPAVARDSAFVRNVEELETYAREARGLDSLVAESRDSVVLGQHPTLLAGRRATYRMWKDNQSLRSAVYLFVIGEHYIKVRVSFIPDQTDLLAPHILNAVQTILDGVSQAP